MKMVLRLSLVIVLVGQFTGLNSFAQEANSGEKINVDPELVMSLATLKDKTASDLFFGRLKGRVQFEITKKALTDPNNPENDTSVFTLSSVYKNKKGQCVNETLTLTVASQGGYIDSSSAIYKDTPEKAFSCE